MEVCSLTLDCTVTVNGMVDIGAGMYIKDDSSPTVVNCKFTRNLPSTMGGGTYTKIVFSRRVAEIQ